MVSVDRDAARPSCPTHDRAVVLSRVATAVTTPLRRGSTTRWSPAATPGSVRGRCWNGSPYQPVPVARRRPPAVALRILEQPEDYPARDRPAAEPARLPQPVRRQPRPRRSATSARSRPASSTHARKDARHLASTPPAPVGRAGVEQEYDRYLRGQPGYQQVAVDSMGRVLGNDGQRARPARRHPGHLDRRQGAGHHRARPGRRDPHRAQRRTTRSPTATTAPTPAPRSCCEARTGRVVAMASQPTYDPSVWVGGISSKQLAAALLRRGRRPAARPGPAGPVRARLDVEAVHDGRARSTTASRPTPGSTARRASRSATGSSTTTSPSRSGCIDFAKALQLSCDTFFYRVGYHFWQKYGSDPTERRTPRDPLVDEAKAFGFGRPTGIDLPGEAAGRIADRHWKLAYWKCDEGLLLRHRPAPAGRRQRLPAAVRPRVLPRGQLLPGR